ncbi:hypothetical protein ACX3V1_15505 [Escherichia coli]
MKYHASARGGMAQMELIVALAHSACAVSYTHLRAHETSQDLVCRLRREKRGGPPPPPPPPPPPHF